MPKQVKKITLSSLNPAILDKKMEYYFSRAKITKKGCWIPKLAPKSDGYVRLFIYILKHFT